MSGLAALVVGHGSDDLSGPRSAVFELVQALVDRGLVEECWPAFWKGQPGLHQGLELCASSKVVVLPVFLAEGYFGAKVLPRELGLSGSHGGVQVVGERHVVLAAPFGTYDALADSAATMVHALRLDQAPTVLLVGHGTRRSKRSGDSMRALAAALDGLGFRTVLGFLDQNPTVAEAMEQVGSRDTVVVPFFASRGGHVEQDLPAALGLDPSHEGESFQEVKTGGGTTRVHVLPPLGCSSVVLDWAQAAIDSARTSLHGLGAEHTPARRARQKIADRLSRDGHVQVGELSLSRDGAGYRASGVHAITEGAGRVWTPYSWNGEQRVASAVEAATLIDRVYPGASLALSGEGVTLGWKAFASRQTGVYAQADAASEAQVQAAVATCCADCPRTPLWWGSEAAKVPCLAPCSQMLQAVCAMQGVERS